MHTTQPRPILKPASGEELMLCLSCQCRYDGNDDATTWGPQEGCYDEACPCHAAYWLTVPEAHKRRLWGDR